MKVIESFRAIYTIATSKEQTQQKRLHLIANLCEELVKQSTDGSDREMEVKTKMVQDGLLHPKFIEAKESMERELNDVLTKFVAFYDAAPTVSSRLGAYILHAKKLIKKYEDSLK